MHVAREISRVTFVVEPFVFQVDEIEALPQVLEITARFRRTLFDGERTVAVGHRRQRLRRIDFHHDER